MLDFEFIMFIVILHLQYHIQKTFLCFKALTKHNHIFSIARTTNSSHDMWHNSQEN